MTRQALGHDCQPSCDPARQCDVHLISPYSHTRWPLVFSCADNVRLLPMGDAALTVEFSQEIDQAANMAVMALDAALIEAPPRGLVETVPTFRSLTVHINPLETSLTEISELIRRVLTELHARASVDHQVSSQSSKASRVWTLPVCYEGAEYAPDLADLARTANMTPEAVVAAHTARTYRVYMLGFLPGLPYMGDIDPAIDLPRRTDPRVRVPAGSVAIAVGLTVVYPLESPGGWHILGRTPVSLFSSTAAPYALLAPGDAVRFEAVDQATFHQLAQNGVDPARLRQAA